MPKVLDESLIYEILSVVEEIPEGRRPDGESNDFFWSRKAWNSRKTGW